MTNYESDDKEHNFGRFQVTIGDTVVTRFWERQHAEDKVAVLREKVYGRSACVVDGNPEGLTIEQI